MQRLDLSQLIAELNLLTNRKSLPKVKNIKKMEKEGYFSDQHFSLYRVRPQILMVSAGVSDVKLEHFQYVQDLLNFLLEKRGEGLYVLSGIAYNAMDDFLEKYFFLIDQVGEKSSEGFLYQVEVLMQIYVLLHNHFCLYHDNDVKSIDKFHNIESSFYIVASHMLDADQISDENLQRIKLCLKANKKFIHARRDIYKNNIYAFFMMWNVLAARLAFKKGDLVKAKQYIKQGIGWIEFYGSKVPLGNYELIALCKRFSMLAYSKKNFLESLSWINLTFEALDYYERFFQQCIAGEFMLSGVIDAEKGAKGIQKDRAFLKAIKIQCKKQLKEYLRVNLKELSALMKDGFIIELDEDGKVLISAKVDKAHLDTFVSRFNKYNVICTLDSSSGKMIIYNLFRVEISLVKKIICECVADIDTKVRLAVSATALEQAEIVKDKPVSYTQTKTFEPEKIKATSDDKSAKESKEKKEEVEEKVGTERNEREVTLFAQFSDCLIYPLYGETAHNQYIVINQQFLFNLSVESPETAKELVAICERGRVLNNSEGKKGILILGDIVKLKDSSKAGRFFGQKVATEVHGDKTCQLFEVNRYDRDPHK